MSRVRTITHPRGPLLVERVNYEAAARRLVSFIDKTQQSDIPITSTLIGHWIQEVVDAALEVTPPEAA